MKKMIFAFIIILVISSLAFPKKIGTLTGIFKPQMIKVFDNDLFVVEGFKTFIYSLDDLSLKKVIGKKGEGPGEFDPDPARTIIITVFPDTIIGESRYKVAWFSREGNFIKEARKSPGILQTVPVGKNFLIHKILYGPEGQNYFTLNLHDSDMKEIKELYRQKFFDYENKTFIMPDPLNFCLCDNKIFIEKSPDGFIIDAYDFDGNQLYRIERTFEKIPVREYQKKEAYKDFLEIPFLKRMIREQGQSYYENYLKTVTLVYPDFFPAIQDISADAKTKKLYVKTYNKKDQKEEYLVMDVKGNPFKTLMLPEARKVDFLVQMQGDKKYYNIHNDGFYYLKFIEGEDDEDWEVHVENLK